MSFTIAGDSREATLLALVGAIAFAEGRTGAVSNFAFLPGKFSREWLADTFAFARVCIDGPPTK